MNLYLPRLPQSVSYTHLDVYKRQLYLCARLRDPVLRGGILYIRCALL